MFEKSILLRLNGQYLLRNSVDLQVILSILVFESKLVLHFPRSGALHDHDQSDIRGRFKKDGDIVSCIVALCRDGNGRE